MAPCHERWLHAYDARAYLARPAAPRTKGLLHRDRSLARDRPAAGPAAQHGCMTATGAAVGAPDTSNLHAPRVPADLVHCCGPLRHR